MEAAYVFGSCRCSYPFEHRHPNCTRHGCLSLEVLIKRISRYELFRFYAAYRPSTSFNRSRISALVSLPWVVSIAISIT